MASEKRILEARFERRMAGRILTLVMRNHVLQHSRLDHLDLLSVMSEDLHYDISENLLLTLCQDMEERGYLKFEQEKDKDNVVSLRRIQITPAGRDIARGIKSDDAVQID